MDLPDLPQSHSKTLGQLWYIVIINIKFRVVIFHVLTKKSQTGLGHSVGRVLFCWAPGSCEKWSYPLVNIQKTMENHNFYGQTHYKWPFSIAMLVYQRVKSIYAIKEYWRRVSAGHSQLMETVSLKIPMANYHPTNINIFGTIIMIYRDHRMLAGWNHIRKRL